MEFVTELENGIMIDELSSSDIAVIGIGLKLPGADNVVEFWNLLTKSKEMKKQIPKLRRNDVEAYLNLKNNSNKRNYFEGAFLDEIDKFDSSFFNISQREADLMDPNQRIFLEVAWKAIEDSGYGGDTLKGSRTGVYVACSNSDQYKQMIEDTNPESAMISFAGNLKSVVASRISYYMDFRGPSMVIDTACSSSLVSLHIACQAIKNGECSQAIVGGVNLSVLPIKKDESFGIESSYGSTRTFDDNSDGTMFGEGAAAVILKPLYRAVEDRDNIYAVIKGSAINQDGSSVGITAPNVLAQQDVIMRAWENANINPETLQYIEAHGTGTILGDPIEIEALCNAFRKHTNKKQFCAIGSVKTNIGHLDYAAGIVGFIKSVLSLKYKKIPSSLHFKHPNRKIDFENSPIYVCDKIINWPKFQSPRRCGVSSFGMSGTNCHVILEELSDSVMYNSTCDERRSVFVLSTKNKESLTNLLRKYRDYIYMNNNLRIDDICFTSCQGRGHYKFRFATIVKNKKELLRNIDDILFYGFEKTKNPNIFYGEVLSSDNSIIKKISLESRSILNELYEVKHNDYNNILIKLCENYTRGASISWNYLYSRSNISRVSLPSYEFENKRCWVNLDNIDIQRNRTQELNLKQISHPLIDRCLVKSMKQDIYVTQFSIDNHWVLKEHKFMGRNFPPGTTFIEMARYLGELYYPEKDIEIRKILFIAPMEVKQGEIKEVQTIIEKEENYLMFTIASMERYDDKEKWVVYAQGQIYSFDKVKDRYIDIEEIKSRCVSTFQESKGTGIEPEDIDSILEFGERWTKVKSQVCVGEKEILIKNDLPEKFYKDLNNYFLHPSLLDLSINSITHSTGNGYYLPLTQNSFKIYDKIPQNLYCYIKNTNDNTENTETLSFDISLFDEKGKIIGEIDKHTIKKINSEKFYSLDRPISTNLFYNISWKKIVQPTSKDRLKGKNCIVFRNENKVCDDIIKALNKSGAKIIEVWDDDLFNQLNEHKYTINQCQENYDKLFNKLKGNIDIIIHLNTLNTLVEQERVEDVQKSVENSIFSMVRIVKSIINNHINNEMEIIGVTDFADEVTFEEKDCNPYNGAFLGLIKVIEQEYPSLKCKCIDMDDYTDIDNIILEISSDDGQNYTAYRRNIRYVREFCTNNLTEMQDSCIQFKDDGVYVIVGGAGGIGFEVAKYIASKSKATIALINRTELPSEDTWDTMKNDITNDLYKKIRSIEQIRGMGIPLIYCSGDISDINKIRDIFDMLKSKYGKINGIIHSAGIIGDGFIFNKSEQKIINVLRPKIYGTWVINKLIKNDPPDFVILMSSVTSILGAPGQGDYTAANAYIDSFNVYQNKRGIRTMAINWSTWKETGMAVDNNVTSGGLFKMLSTTDAMKAFDKLINAGIKRSIVGQLDIDMANSTMHNLPIDICDSINNALNSNQKRNNNMHKYKNSTLEDNSLKLIGRSESKYDSTELLIGKAWGKVLGESEFDINASFSEMGGDSILATQLLKEVEKIFPETIDITDIFTYSTISELSNHINEKLKLNNNKQKDNIEIKHIIKETDIDDVLDKLANGIISSDMAEKLLGFKE